MASIARPAAMLAAPFFFLVTLLFNPSALGAFAWGSAEATPAPVVFATVGAMACAMGCFAVLESRSAKVGRAAVIASAAPVLALVLLGIEASVPEAGAGARLVLSWAVVVLTGMAAIAQMRAFAWSLSLGSRDVFLASSLSLAVAVLLSYGAFSFLAPAAGVGFLAAAQAVAGIEGIRTSMLSPMAGLSGSAGAVEEERAGEGDGRQRIRDLVALGLPLLLTSFFCALVLGQTWEERLLSEFDGQLGLLVLVLAIALVFAAAVYRQWSRAMSVDAFLVGLVVPLALPVLVAMLESLLPAVVIVSMLLLSQILYLLYAWVSMLLIGRMLAVTDAVTSWFIVAFLALFAVFMWSPQVQYVLFVSRFMTLASLGLLIYLLFHFYHEAAQRPASTEAPALEMNRALRQRCDEAAALYGLSPRESELLPFFAVGFSAGVIGKRVIISDHTVKTHRYRIYQKIGVGSHEELVEKLGLVERAVSGTDA